MEKQEIFLKPKYAYTSNEKTWYACPKCGHLIAYLVPRCDNCRIKMKWSEKK